MARDRGRLEELAAELRTAESVEVSVWCADPNDLDAVAGRLGDDEPPVDLLVNNAGAVGAVGPFAARCPRTEELRLRLNVIAVMRLTQAAVSGLARAGAGEES